MYTQHDCLFFFLGWFIVFLCTINLNYWNHISMINVTCFFRGESLKSRLCSILFLFYSSKHILSKCCILFVAFWWLKPMGCSQIIFTVHSDKMPMFLKFYMLHAKSYDKPFFEKVAGKSNLILVGMLYRINVPI